MGNYASKLLFYTNESQKECNEPEMVVQQATVEDNSICTPILSEKRVLGDPRSVSAGIKRTPIEIKCTSIGENKKPPSAMPKYLQKKQYLEADMYVVMQPLTPKKRVVLKSMDSDEQSDSFEVQNSTTNVNITRSSKVITPIDKERFIILGLDPRSPAADFDRTPILMPKSLALIKARSQENLSRRGSYETDVYNPKNSRQKIDTAINILETRLSDTALESLKVLDTEKQDGVHGTSVYNSNLSISKSEKEITVIKNPKYMSEEISLISDEQIATLYNEEDKDETEKQDCENIKSSTKIRNDDKIKLWHDSLSPEKSISDFRKKGDTKGKKKNTKIDVNEEKVFTPENKQEIETYENRTPLGNRSNNNQIKKKPQQLLKSMTTSIEAQENTPPSKTYNRKTRNGTQWDPNSTVLI
ncbi:hypothetical protein ALC62_14707 [Cyphomyrmex costatus]|uniref:Uncharacterized protein n=1 Tax=Cyphomyrmex costatus TaxID=456900 RepID=A0A195C3G1_9HYME|nr:hypothetical protein ALC62_14707 [Cyphomyrmex costatus]